MKQITAITDNAIQQFSITLDDGSIVTINNLIYVPAQQGWFYSLTYGSFQLLNQRIVNSPNMLRKYRNIISFGLCCTVIDGFEPINQSDFVSGRASMYVLNPTDILETETLITQTLPEVSGTPIYEL